MIALGTRATVPFRGMAQRGDVQVGRALAVTAWLVYTVLGQGAITVSDGHVMYDVARSLVDHGSLAVPATDGRVLGQGGHSYSPYGLGLSLISVIPYLLTKPISGLVGHADEIGQFAVSMTMPVIMAGIIAALYAMTLRLGASRRSSVIVSVGTIFGTFLLPYGKDFFAEPLVILGFILGCERVLAGSFGLGAAALGLAVVARPQMALACPLFLALVLHRGGWKPALRTSAILAVVGAFLAIYNAARYGSVTEFGYGHGPETKFSLPILKGLHGFFLDPTKSVSLFAPIVLLVPVGLTRVRRTDRDLVVFLLVHAVTLLLLYSTYAAWPGGWSWGPRYLFVGVIPLLPLLGPLIDAGARYRRAAAALFLVGALVSFPTLIGPTQAQELDQPTPSIGPGIVRQYELIQPTAVRSGGLLTGTPGQTTPGSHRLYLSTWQVGILRKNGRGGFVVALVLTLFLLGAALRATRSARARENPRLVDGGATG